jgi:hypothetical protein
MKNLIAVILLGLSCPALAHQPYALGFNSERYWSLSHQYAHDIVMQGNINKKSDKSSSYTVRLKTEGSKGPSSCTGIIISDNLILTAGHCLREKDMKVSVQFGLGGKQGFQATEVATGYVSSLVNDPKLGPPIGRDLVQDGYLSYDEGIADSLKARYTSGEYLDLESFGFKEELYFDLAVIRIEKIPKGFTPIPFYRGSIDYHTTVYAAGYGMSSRVYSENTGALHWGKSRVVGHYTNAVSTAAVLTYSPDGQETCFGDSGGPIVVYQGGKPKLLGVNSASLNKCSGGALITVPTHYQQFLKDAFEVLGSSVSI